MTWKLSADAYFENILFRAKDASPLSSGLMKSTILNLSVSLSLAALKVLSAEYWYPMDEPLPEVSSDKVGLASNASSTVAVFPSPLKPINEAPSGS